MEKPKLIIKKKTKNKTKSEMKFLPLLHLFPLLQLLLELLPL